MKKLLNLFEFLMYFFYHFYELYLKVSKVQTYFSRFRGFRQGGLFGGNSTVEQLVSILYCPYILMSRHAPLGKLHWL